MRTTDILRIQRGEPRRRFLVAGIYCGMVASVVGACGAPLSSADERPKLTPRQETAFFWASSYQQQVQQLESALNFKSREPATEYLTYQALRAIQAVRAKQSLDTLSRFIDWQPSMYGPLSAFPEPLEGFPVAVAICEIGGEEAWRTLCSRSYPSDTNERRRILLFAGLRLSGKDKEMLLLRLERWMQRERSTSPNGTSARATFVEQLYRSARDLDFDNPHEWPCYVIRGEMPPERLLLRLGR